MAKDYSFVAVKPTIEGDKLRVEVTWKYQARYRMPDDGGKYACVIPAFDIYFTAKNMNAIEKKSTVLMRMMIQHFLEHTDKKVALKNLSLHLRKLGFRDVNDIVTMKQFVNNKVVRAKFKSQNEIPLGFDEADVINQESTMEVVV